jgi:DNA-directed RNA polymerase subunit beta'
MIFGNISEIQHALNSDVLTLHTKIRARLETLDDDGKPMMQIYDTTAGRMLLAEVLPKMPGVKFDLVNQLLTKKAISKLIDAVYRDCGQKETVIFCDRIMALGFYHACRAGISFGKDDMLIPETKTKIIEDTQDLVRDYEQQYNDGFITKGEKYNKVVDAWAKCTDHVAKEMMDRISAVHIDEETGREKQINSVYMMSHSGARGSPAQMKQLAGMRGLMAKPSGEIIETPIISNFKEGLTVLEYFNSTHGARKGLADTALKTANSGYLTRRLVDVAQDSIITEHDCGTDKGIKLAAVIDSGEVVVSLGDRALGRTAADDIVAPSTGEVILTAGQLIEEADSRAIEEAQVQEIRIRSVLTCETRNGVCAMCYGRDLARGTIVNHGEAVGVIAAQSIGEPGTQLTMRTFHIGGTAQVMDSSFTESNFAGKIVIRNRNVQRDGQGRLVAMARNMAVIVQDDEGKDLATYKLIQGAHLKVDEGDTIKRGQRLAEWDPYTRPILTEVDGVVDFEDLLEGLSVNEQTEETTGITHRVIIDWRAHPKGSALKPALVIKDKKGKVLKLTRGGEARYLLSVDAILSVEPGQKMKAGDVLARIPLESAKTRDITGGLPRVAELFEARRPKDHAIIAEMSGTVEFGRDYKNKRRITIVSDDEAIDPIEYLIPKGKHLSVQEGDRIEKGEFIMDGNPAPHDILAIKGVEELASYLVNEIQEVYRLQGVTINDKHIEVIVDQMLQKVEIEDAGETEFLKGEQIDRVEFEDANLLVEKSGRRPAKANPILLGITKASLQTRSFISAASFQETTRVLTDAAVNGKIDTLDGLKENVIVGRLIPAGTGGMISRLKKVAQHRDDLILEERSRAGNVEQSDEVAMPALTESQGAQAAE